MLTEGDSLGGLWESEYEFCGRFKSKDAALCKLWTSDGGDIRAANHIIQNIMFHSLPHSIGSLYPVVWLIVLQQ
jgi:hypothetical protein